MFKLRGIAFSAAACMAMFAGAANAECSIFENFNYEGKSGVVQNNDLLRFTDDSRSLITDRKVREFRDPSWLNLISSVKVTPGCKAVFWNEKGSHFFFSADTPEFPQEHNDKSIAISCDCR